MISLSFILPLHNLEKYVISCLESIVSSNLLPSSYEIIVWNDGSTDSGPSLVGRFAKTHKNVRLISCENHGVSWARNHAVQEACGEYVWFVDSDDLVHSEAVARLLNKEISNRLDMLLFNWQPISENGTIEDFMLHPVVNGDIVTGRELYLSRTLSMAPWCYIYRRNFLLENSIFFPEDFKTCEDIQFNQKALWKAKRVMTTQEVGYYYRQMTNSATSGNAERLVNDQIRRISAEIEYFAPSKDWKFLTQIIYRNLREVNVWLAKVPKSKLYFDQLKNVLKLDKLELEPKFGKESLFIRFYKISPILVFKTQRLVKKTAKFFVR